MSWDFDTTYQYALSLISRRTYNYGALQKKLSEHANADTISQVIEEINKHHFINEQQLCNDTACMWIQKKPISYIQLYQKLQSYHFNTQEIQKSMVHIAEQYNTGIFSFIGGFSLSQLQEIYHHIHTLSVWDVLALAGAWNILQSNTGNTVGATTIISRLKKRGFTIPHTLYTIISDMTQE